MLNPLNLPSGRPFRNAIVLTLTVLLLALAFPLSATAQIDQAKPAASAAPQAAADPHAGLFTDPGSASAAASMDDELSAMQLAASRYAAQDRNAFIRGLDLAAFRLLAIQHNDQIKIMDSWARQCLRKIAHTETLEGRDSLYTALDMAIRSPYWMNKNIIYVESVPIREELGFFAGNAAEAQRIRQEARVSPSFLLQPQVRDRLKELSLDSRQLSAVNKVYIAANTFFSMGDTLAFLPPPPGVHSPWVNPYEVVKSETAKPAAGASATLPAAAAAADDLPPYTADQKLRINAAFQKLVAGWQDNDVSLANQGLAEFTTLAQSIDPAHYPSHAKRVTELWYNRTYSGTLVSFIYFLAMTLFLLVAIGITGKRAQRTAVGIFAFALLCHISAMGIRWWLNGRIPIQNQFESVLGSACIGCIIGLVLESWKKNGIFGTAFAFVGFLATTTLLAAPYVFGNDLGSAPGKVAGILANTAWLYIHVNIVIASYALIFASAVIAGLFLLMRQWYWINPIEPGFSSSSSPSPSSSDFPEEGLPRSKTLALAANTQEVQRITAQRSGFLDTLDQANMVVLQMAFWFLGIGIICGAIWADKSWGRPWGWDPKETFALVTWIVYLIIVHIRLVIKHKADTTAWLSLVGCGVMLFNWIGVNFFLAGLHSYA